MRPPVVVLTGSTGAFGKSLIESLVKESPGIKLILLIRADSQDHAVRRLHKLALTDRYTQRIRVLRSDLSSPDLGLRQEELDELNKTATHILHAAASTRFTLSLAEARRNNVDTTQYMINFALSCKSLERFGFVSTAFVAGKRTGTVYESELEHDEGFLNTYEQTKYEAEVLVKRQHETLPVIVFRPSLILSPHQSQNASSGLQNALALGISLASKGFLPMLPGDPDSTLDIVTGDFASQAITKLLLKNQLSQTCYHITRAFDSPKIKEIIGLIEDGSGEKLPIRFTGDMVSFTAELKKVSRFRPDLKLIYKKVGTFLPELAYPKVFNNSNLKEELGDCLVSSNALGEIRLLLR